MISKYNTEVLKASNQSAPKEKHEKKASQILHIKAQLVPKSQRKGLNGIGGTGGFQRCAGNKI